MVISVIAVCSTVLGEGSFCCETSPELLTSCQMTSTASGLISRYQAGGGAGPRVPRARRAAVPRLPGPPPGPRRCLLRLRRPAGGGLAGRPAGACAAGAVRGGRLLPPVSVLPPGGTVGSNPVGVFPGMTDLARGRGSVSGTPWWLGAADGRLIRYGVVPAQRRAGRQAGHSAVDCRPRST